MKKSKLFLKSLIGIPIGIFVLELFNICLSIKYGQYVRLDSIENGFFLNNILISYICCAITSYLLMIYLSYSKYILELGLSIKGEKKANKKAYPILILILIVTFLVVCTGNLPALIGIIASFVWNGIAVLIITIENLLNKYSVKQINEKLKEVYKK